MGRTPQGVRGLKHDEGKLREDASRRTFQGVTSQCIVEKLSSIVEKHP